MSNAIFLIDANIMIQAHRLYYPFDFSSAFWDALIREHKKRRIFSISHVKREICRSSEPEKADLLEQWVRDVLPDSFFLEPDDAVILQYKAIMQWSNSQLRYGSGAQAHFASGADGWLIAYAAVHDMVVVTHEKPEPNSARIKIPDVCLKFNVTYVNTFEMLRQLDVRFVLQ